MKAEVARPVNRARASQLVDISNYGVRCRVVRGRTHGACGSKSLRSLPLVIQQCSETLRRNLDAIGGEESAFDRRAAAACECHSWSGLFGQDGERLGYVAPEVASRHPRIPQQQCIALQPDFEDWVARQVHRATSRRFQPLSCSSSVTAGPMPFRALTRPEKTARRLFRQYLRIPPARQRWQISL